MVAYAVEMAWLVKHTRTRGDKTKKWIGVVSGLGSCGVIGIIFAVALLDHHGTPMNTGERFAATWSVFSLALLAGLVGVLPNYLYEIGHDLTTDYSDE